jgi:putative transposase
MPNHFHAVLTVNKNSTVERAMQKIKGGFSYRAKRELSLRIEIWQRGFSDKRVRSRDEFFVYRHYIHMNPVKAGLAMAPEDFPYSSAHPRFRITPSVNPTAKAEESPGRHD